MRGDSVRDLYAKTLALLGLGVLAGTGALVDYWPASRVELPQAEPALSSPDTSWVALPADPVLPVEVEQPVAEPDVEAPVPVLPQIPVSALRVEAVALAAPPPDVLRPVAWVSTNHTEIPLTEFDEFALDPSRVGFDSRVALPAVSDNNDWWIAGAVKRTGSSLARTGARTKESFVDMFRAVNRAVRRALPD